MRLGVQTLLTIAAAISMNCGGGSGGGTVTAPSVPGAQPPTVNVGFQPVDGTSAWVGRASTNEGGSSDDFGLTVQQMGAQVTGDISSTAWGSLSLGRSGPFWHKDYFDRFILDEGHLARTIDYVENNPVKAGLVPAVAAWPWSYARLRA